MRSARFILAAAALWLAGAPPASAHVEFGRPDYSNYIAPYGWGTCDWWTSAWLHACPGVLATPAAAPVAAPAIVKAKSGGAKKPAK
ncbi:MAG TPA: hypothetical protein VK456_08155 [Xanthobacteraceae bacterium]|nr:hypothetical protein [Xanthobacteraceae bacterium]